MTAPPGPVLLSVRGLSRRFGGTLALDAVDLAVGAGEVHALLGENGAGKSTLIKVLAGIHRADAGEVMGPEGPQEPGRPVPGVAFVHQDLGLVPTASVAENLCIGRGFPRRLGLIDWRGAEERAARDLAAVGLDLDPRAPLGRLGAAERSLVAIARALAREAHVLVLDEPTATLPERDVARLLDALAGLRARGIGILYVTHRLDEVLRLADRVTVLRDGRRVHDGPVAGTDAPALAAHILGRRLAWPFPALAVAGGRVVLTARGLRSRHAGPVDLDLHAGEVLALAGLRNSGQDVIGRLIAGALPARGGAVTLDGAPLPPGDLRRAAARGVGLVPARRIEEGLAPALTVGENLLPVARRVGLRLIGTKAERALAAHLARAFGVRPPAPARGVLTLSGGNQQKVVLARWLAARLRVLVLEEPTAGVDVGARAEIYDRVAQACVEGLAVLLVSSDLEEVAGLAHRAVVFGRGRPVGTLAGGALTAAALAALAGGRAAA